jgi:hypothetical protein
MTKEQKALKNLKDILAEATMDENSVCYVTGEDKETLEIAIKALEQQPCDESIKYFESNDIDIQKFTKALKMQPLQIIKSNTSEDCVSRQAVLSEAELIELEDGQSFMSIDPEDVKALPPVTPTQSWIPVSERLPEDRNIVLVTAYWHETYQVMMASYFGEGLWWCVPFNNCGDHMQKLNPKAWQPLPQPYKEKRGDENGSN